MKKITESNEIETRFQIRSSKSTFELIWQHGLITLYNLYNCTVRDKEDKVKNKIKTMRAVFEQNWRKTENIFKQHISACETF